MSRRPVRPLYLARRTYRLRRLRDLSRALPLMGAVAFNLPLLLTLGSGGRTGGVMLYIFGVWVLLVGFAALLATPVSRAEAEAGLDGSHSETR